MREIGKATEVQGDQRELVVLVQERLLSADGWWRLRPVGLLGRLTGVFCL